MACTPAGGGATASKPAASTSAPAPPPATVSSAPAAGSAASTAPAAPAGPVALTVGAVSPNALLWTLYVAQGKGFLEREGVQLDLTYTGSTASATQSLVAGSVDLGNGSIDNFVRAIESGAQLVAVVGEQAPPTYSLLGQPSIASVADLRGKLIMIGGPKDPTLFFIQRMLRPLGLADDDYELTYAGGTAERYAALQSGAVAATLLGQPFDFAAERQGYRRLANQWDAPLDYQFIGYAVRRDWAASHEDALVRFLRAFRGAHRWLHDPSNRDEAIAILTDVVKLQPEDARETYDLIIVRLKAFAPDGEITERAMQGVLDSIVALGDLPAPPPPVSKYVDNRYIQAAGR
jgi:ABC-type nitrate/sulfonate/bicarbonate transport system substrate-binding protein